MRKGKVRENGGSKGERRLPTMKQARTINRTNYLCTVYLMDHTKGRHRSEEMEDGREGKEGKEEERGKIIEEVLGIVLRAKGEREECQRRDENRE